MTIGEKALSYVTEEAVVGLGTGRAATSFIQALGERVRGGLRVRGVATSRASAELARELGIPLLELEDLFVPAGPTHPIDVTVDGADEVDPALDLIKGYGGALVREKIVAAASRRLVILVGKEKLVPVLGSRGKLPVEVVPFGIGLCARWLRELGCPGEVRRDAEGAVSVTDNLNLILDCRIGRFDGKKPRFHPRL